ncbi:hypothetical protein LGN22_15195 [Burkholderia cenocepacia]|uniref:Uncharacterized protein n=1 Tax=Burkholderia cenocepacia TaxID=95486 RepID=A0AAW4TDS5_9BURK|nr:hypothetical protein [Burkholderia cenocepacia]MCA8380219.1 hypothetical protein [Burkholderia cenocepacia]
MRLNERPGLCRVFCLRLWVDDRKRLFRGDAAAFRADGWGRVDSYHPITNHQSPITDHRSPITDHRSPITDPLIHHRHRLTTKEKGARRRLQYAAACQAS